MCAFGVELSAGVGREFWGWMCFGLLGLECEGELKEVDLGGGARVRAGLVRLRGGSMAVPVSRASQVVPV